MKKAIKGIGFAALILSTTVMVLAFSSTSTASDEKLTELAKQHTPEITTIKKVDDTVSGNTNPVYEQEFIQHQKNVQHEIDKYYSSLPKEAGSGMPNVPDIFAPGEIIQKTIDHYYSSLPPVAGSGKDYVPDLFAPGEIIQRTIDQYYSSLPPAAGSGKDPVPDILNGDQLMQRAIDEYYEKH